MAAAPSPPAASVTAATAVAGRTRGAGRPPGSTGAALCPPPGGPSRARGTRPRPTRDTCTATAGTGLRTRSAPTRRRRGCRRARTPTRAPGSPSGSAATTPWIGSASEAGPTGAVGAGAGAEAAAIGRATLRGGRPEGEAAPGSVAAKAGGSPRLENVSLRRERGGGPVLLRWAWAWPCRATWPKAVGRDAFPSRSGSEIPAAVTEREAPKLILEVGRASRPCLRRGCWEVGLLPWAGLRLGRSVGCREKGKA